MPPRPAPGAKTSSPEHTPTYSADMGYAIAVRTFLMTPYLEVGEGELSRYGARFARRALGADQEFEASSRLALDAGCGFGLPGNRGVLTPYAGLTLGDAGNRTVRTGARWRLNPNAVLGLEATRQTSAADDTANEIRLRAALRF